MKIALTFVTLALSLWAPPAPATSSRAEKHEGLVVATVARSARAAKQIDVRLRSDWKEVAAHERRKNANRFAPTSRRSGSEWGQARRASKQLGHAGPAVPEPSAAMLFGVGVILALQAIPRRRRGSDVDGEVTVAPEVA